MAPEIVRVFHCKGPAEPAAIVGVLHLHELGAVHPAQQLPGLLMHADAAQQVAGVVIGDPAAVAGPHVLHLQDIDQEFGELVGPGGDGVSRLRQRGSSRKRSA